MKISKSQMATGLKVIYIVTLAGAGCAYGAPVTEGTGKTTVTTPLELHEGGDTVIAKWAANTGTKDILSTGDALGTISVITPGAPTRCELYVKSPDSVAGRYAMKQAGKTVTLDARLTNTDGTTIPVTDVYDSNAKVNGSSCNATINVVSERRQELPAGQYTGTVMLTAVIP